MKLIFGLGNPGKKYQTTRHNLGQKIINQYLQDKKLPPLVFKKNLYSKICQIGQGSQKNILAISTDFMNNSGISVYNIANFYKISSKNIYIIHDDLDLSVGDFKTQFDRGSAGHNGIKSIIQHLQTQAFYRLRIGINSPQNHISTEDYVLQPFTSNELDIIESLNKDITNQIDSFLSKT